MLPEYIIYVTVAISFFAYLAYFRDIFYGTTRPNLVSWFFWMLAPFIGFFFQIQAGAGLSALPVFLSGFGPVLVILFSIWHKNSYWKITTTDILCGIFALLALVCYIFTHNLSISIVFAIVSDIIAGIPTIIKTWKFPETETFTVYLAGTVNNVLGLLILKDWIFSIYSFSIYLVFINIIVILLIYRKKILNWYNK